MGVFRPGFRTPIGVGGFSQIVDVVEFGFARRGQLSNLIHIPARQPRSRARPTSAFKQRHAGRDRPYWARLRHSLADRQWPSAARSFAAPRSYCKSPQKWRYESGPLAAAKRCRPANRRPHHHDDAAALRVFDKTLGDDPPHHPGGSVLPPLAIEAQAASRRYCRWARLAS